MLALQRSKVVEGGRLGSHLNNLVCSLNVSVRLPSYLKEVGPCDVAVCGRLPVKVSL